MAVTCRSLIKQSGLILKKQIHLHTQSRPGKTSYKKFTLHFFYGRYSCL